MKNRDYYDEFSQRYEERRHHGYHALIDRLEIDLAVRFAEGRDVLEAGCGTGLILRALAQKARRAVGIDLSAGMLSHARGRGLDVVQASITDLPFADESFDVVCSFKVLAHIEQIERAVQEMSRVTRPGGHLVLEFYNPYSLRGLVKRLKPATAISHRVDDEAVYTRYDTLGDVERLLPPGHTIIDLRGVRVLTPAAVVFDIAPVGRMLGWLERLAADAPGLRRLGGFLIAVVRKPG